MDAAVRRTSVLLALSLFLLSGVLQLAVAVATITLVLVTGVDSTLGLEPAIFIASGALAALPAGAALGPRLVGFTDLLAGRLLGASPALLGGAAYSEWGVVAVAVGATLAVVVPGPLILLRVGALAPGRGALETAG